MFEKFTEKAINVITEAQEQAKLMNNAYVQPEHLLLAIVKQAKGISLKLIKDNNITYEEIQKVVDKKLRFEKAEKKILTVPFADSFKNLLKNALDLANNSENNYILFEHLFLTVINDELSYNRRILEQFNFNIDNSRELLQRLVQRKTKRLSHPEIEESKEPETPYLTENFFLDSSESSDIFEKALAKLSATNYELLGTEQILSSILESNTETSKILKEKGINIQIFEKELSNLNSRNAEYENKQIIFTPSAFTAMNLALQTAKEVGSLDVKPEHIILGLLKAKQGIAYDIIKKLNINEDDLAHEILKPLEKQMPQALTILRMAKQEARRLGRNVVGTEMILLGIISEGTSIGFEVLNGLGITLKDTRQIIEKFIGYGNEYFDKEIIFTKRAKKILEIAWQKAKKYNKHKIMSEHLLYAITTEPNSVAMKTLEQLGVDAVEIRQGILKELEKLK